jgi:glycosyltransferase involved in cell wall biosynthesis
VNPDLFAVMPVYDEAAAVAGVAREWIAALREAGPRFTLLAIDDGSRDATPAILDALAGELPELCVLHQANAGHGAACAAGYRAALASGAAWVFQLDSDGQCDPRHFAALWAAREGADAVLGERVQRGDGTGRVLISRLLRAVTRAATGLAVRDANVPYRLMRRDALAACLPDVPAGFELQNVALAVLLVRRFRVRWTPIAFRARSGRQSGLSMRRLLRQALRLFADLRRPRPALV